MAISSGKIDQKSLTNMLFQGMKEYVMPPMFSIVLGIIQEYLNKTF